MKMHRCSSTRAGVDCLRMLMHFGCLHTGVTDFPSNKYVPQTFIFFPTRREHSGPIRVSGMYERGGCRVFMMLLNA